MSTDARTTAIGRLMTICPQKTPEERHAQAEWIVDAILAAAHVNTCERLLDANAAVARKGAS